MALLPRLTLSSGAIFRWHLVGRRLRWLLDGLGSGLRVVDVGCGRGEYAIDIARRFPTVDLSCGVDKMGRDAAGSFLSVAAALAGRVRLLEGRFCPALVASLGPFDAALCVDVIEHIQDDAAFVRDIAATIRHGGRLLVHVPAEGQWHPVRKVAKMTAREIEGGKGPHLREGYTRDGLAGLLRTSGWRVCELRPTFGPLAALWTDADMALSLRGRLTVPLRALCLPLTLAGAVVAPFVPPRTGNGWLALAERMEQ